MHSCAIAGGFVAPWGTGLDQFSHRLTPGSSLYVSEASEATTLSLAKCLLFAGEARVSTAGASLQITACSGRGRDWGALSALQRPLGASTIFTLTRNPPCRRLNERPLDLMEP